LPEDRFTQARILIIEDDRAAARKLRRILEDAGYRSVVGVDGQEGFRLAREADTPPDLVVVGSPARQEGGWPELLAWLTEDDRSRPPILALCDESEDEICDTATECIFQPIRKRELLCRVHNLLARRHLELDLRDHERRLEEAVQQRTRELQESLDRLRRVSQERHNMAIRIVSDQEEERRRIAAEIHDGIVQTLVALRIRLSMLGREISGQSGEEIEKLEGTISDSLVELRTLLLDMRTPSLGEGGLALALPDYLARVQESGGPPCTVKIETSDRPPREAEAMLLRIAQEALANVRKHASATAVEVALSESDGGTLLTVRDDGCGFDASAPEEPGHLGLALMRERASITGGWCSIESEPGHGTTVRAWVPHTSVHSRAE
jgi:signal transduction histidine kinase